MAITYRMVEITKEMASVKIPYSKLTVGEVAKLGAIAVQGEGLGIRWDIYHISNGRALDVTASTDPRSPWVKINVRRRSDMTVKTLWEKKG